MGNSEAAGVLALEASAMNLHIGGSGHVVVLNYIERTVRQPIEELSTGLQHPHKCSL